MVDFEAGPEASRPRWAAHCIPPVHLLLDGEDASKPLPLQGPAAKATLTAPAGRHYLRLEVCDDAGASELISSPLYINFPEE